MFTKIWSKITTRQANRPTTLNLDAGVSNPARQLMENAERYAGRTPRYASDLRRAAQAQLTLSTYMA
ncbi:MAG: hypothetical protein QM617_07445 [Comamonas sp.]